MFDTYIDRQGNQSTVKEQIIKHKLDLLTVQTHGVVVCTVMMKNEK